MHWTSFWRGNLDGMRQSVWDVPRSKRLARDGALYSLFALFFYMQCEYKGAYTVSIISVILCLTAILCVNLIDKIPKYVPLALNLIEMAAFSYYTFSNGLNEIACVIAILATVYILLVYFDILPN